MKTCLFIIKDLNQNLYELCNLHSNPRQLLPGSGPLEIEPVQTSTRENREIIRSRVSMAVLCLCLCISMECVALKATIVMPILLLQKPSRSSKNRDHISCLERRLPLWSEGISYKKGVQFKPIRIPKHSLRKVSSSQPARMFADKMFNGKTKEALKDKEKARVLKLEEYVTAGNGESLSVRSILREKHPPSQFQQTLNRWFMVLLHPYTM